MPSADVLVQLGDQRYTSILCLDEVGAVITAYPRHQMSHVEGFRDFDMSSAALVASRMMIAALEGRHHDVCVCAWWMIFRRPGEEVGLPTHRALDRIVQETGGVRVILIADELCQMDSMHIHLADPLTPDDDLDLTPRLSRSAA